MKRNLGALSYDTDESCFGLYYQWGRKDPFRINSSFLGVERESNTQSPTYFINHPDVYCEKNNPNAGGWSKTAKSFFEPCPSGWKLPPPEAWNSLWNSGGTELTYYSRYEATGQFVPQYEYGYYFPNEYKFGFWAHTGYLYGTTHWANGTGKYYSGEGWSGREGCYWTNDNRTYTLLSGSQNYEVGFGKQDGFYITLRQDTAHDYSIYNSFSIRCIKE